MHLFGQLLRLYWDARSAEHQNKYSDPALNNFNNFWNLVYRRRTRIIYGSTERSGGNVQYWRKLNSRSLSLGYERTLPSGYDGVLVYACTWQPSPSPLALLLMFTFKADHFTFSCLWKILIPANISHIRNSFVLVSHLSVVSRQKCLFVFRGGVVGRGWVWGWLGWKRGLIYWQECRACCKELLFALYHVFLFLYS